MLISIRSFQFFTVLILLVTQNVLASTNKCINVIQRKFSLEKIQTFIRPGNESVILEHEHSDKVVILVHGFIGSPFEVRALGEELYRQGVTVVMPLLPGFGRTTKEANTVKAEMWTNEIHKLFDELAPCYSKVSLAGFSLGGSVVSYVALNDVAFFSKLDTVTLISPALYLKNQFFIDLFLPFRFMVGNSFTVQNAASISKKLGNSDLDTPNSHPDFYNLELPLNAVNELRRLNKKIRFSNFKRLGDRKVTFIFSDYDKAVDGFYSWKKAHYFNQKVHKFQISASKKALHQILLPDQNNYYFEIIAYAAHTILN